MSPIQAVYMPSPFKILRVINIFIVGHTTPSDLGFRQYFATYPCFPHRNTSHYEQTWCVLHISVFSRLSAQ